MAQSPKGIEVRQTTVGLLFDAFLQDNASALLFTGTTTVRVCEVQSNGTLKSYDFADDTFKTTALTTATLALTARASNNGATANGYWTAVLATLTGFTVGGIYLVFVTNTGAVPPTQCCKFQFGGDQGDMVPLSAAAVALFNAMYGAAETGTAQAGGASTITLRSGAVSTDDYYKNQAVYILSGTGTGQTRKISSYVGSTRVATVDTAWAVNPDNTSVYVVLGKVG